MSEGRHEPTIAALVDSCRVPGVRVLHVDPDPDHNRTVVTLVGDPLALQEALVALAGECLERIDLRRQVGIHPRVGALDVAPIVALDESELPLACELAGAVAEQIAFRWALPVIAYGAIASDPARDRPHHFRARGTEWLAGELAAGRVVPLAGPPRLHPTAGCVLVGARLPLIALNVWLPDATVEEARIIAARVREDGGGPPGLRALGLYLPSRRVCQVSMNIEDFRRTPVALAVGTVRREAERIGVRWGDTELVGLVPRAAVQGPSPSALGIRGFRPGMIVEALTTAWDPPTT